MKQTSRKNLWWTLLIAAAGSVLFFFALVLIHGSFPGRNEMEIYLWPLSGLVLSPLALSRLRALYLLEPAQKLQFSLTDLLAIGFLAGVLLSFFQWAMPALFLKLRLPYIGLICAAMPLGAASARDENFSTVYLRYLYTVGYSFRLVGGVAAGALAMLVVTLGIFQRNGVMHFVGDILSLQNKDWQVWMFRLGLIFFACGIAACRTARALNEPNSTQPS